MASIIGIIVGIGIMLWGLLIFYIGMISTPSHLRIDGLLMVLIGVFIVLPTKIKEKIDKKFVSPTLDFLFKERW